ncbi:MAG: sigma-70 family RNA polymerase sigma factor [Chitinophagaceae bacterium]
MPLDSYNDELKLLNRLKAGDKLAFTRFYEMYSRPLYLNLLKLLKSEPAAEEILQDIFLIIWEKREAISINFSIKSYMFRIAENKTRDFFRKLKRDRKLHDYIREVSSGEYAEVEDKILHTEETILLNKAIENLPSRRKQVFYLCKIQGKSYHEVSCILGISTSTINDHVVKATRTIRDFILTHNGVTAAWLPVILFLYKGTH